MKDKLRELAERWRCRAEKGDVGGFYLCAAEVMDILDAEGDGVAVGAEQLAEKFHEAYERLAHKYGYRTREQSSVPWPDVPPQNKALMIDVCGELLKHFPNPARSGVVSDEDVEACVTVMKAANAAQWNATKDVTWSHGMRAALEHFAKGERHER